VSASECYRIVVELPAELEMVDAGDARFRISVEGRDAPMRTVTFVDRSDLGNGLMLQFTTYRTLATVEIIKR
jgi:hypothetical protein